MTKLTNITDPKYRCTFGACPAVYRSEDGKTFVIIGELVNPDAFGLTPGFEADVKISADLLLSSLGLPSLIEAAERADALLQKLVEEIPPYLTGDRDDDDFISCIIELLDNPDQAETFRALRAAIKGVSNG